MIRKADTEQIVSLPVYNPESRGRSRSFIYMGKVDRVEWHHSVSGRVVDWKSATDPSKTIRGKVISFQPESYAVALQGQGHRIDEVEFRVIARPGISLCGKDDKLAKDNGTTPEVEYEKRCYEWLLERSDERLMSVVHQITESRLNAARQFWWGCIRLALTAHDVAGYDHVSRIGRCGSRTRSRGNFQPARPSQPCCGVSGTTTASRLEMGLRE